MPYFTSSKARKNYYPRVKISWGGGGGLRGTTMMAAALVF